MDYSLKQKLENYAVEILTAHTDDNGQVFLPPGKKSIVVENTEYIFQDKETRDRMIDLILNKSNNNYRLVA